MIQKIARLHWQCKASRFYYVVLECQALNYFVIFRLIVSVT